MRILINYIRKRKSFVLFTALKVLIMGLSLVTNIFIVRKLTINDYGVFSSFYSLNTGEQNLLFFNDLNPNKNTIQLAVLRKSGELIYGKVPQSKVRDNYIFIPSKSLKIHDRAVLLPVVYSKNFIGIVKLSF